MTTESEQHGLREWQRFHSVHGIKRYPVCDGSFRPGEPLDFSLVNWKENGIRTLKNASKTLHVYGPNPNVFKS